MSIADLQLEHFSNVPLSLDALIIKEQRRTESCYDKPRGFWVSVKGDDDWRSWTEAEGFGRGPLCYSVVLSDGANVLHLQDADDIDSFTRRYSTIRRWGVNDRYADILIQWPVLAKEYDGIVISPYCGERRLDRHTSWYYCWDCASGCIWNPRAIASLELVENLTAVSA
jgi:hypothetical protein